MAEPTAKHAPLFLLLTQVHAPQAVPSPGKVVPEQIVWDSFCSSSDLKVVTLLQWPGTLFPSFCVARGCSRVKLLKH